MLASGMRLNFKLVKAIPSQIFSQYEPHVVQAARMQGEASSGMQPHMKGALQQISKKLSHVDVVIEMRDARIPRTSANYTLETIRELTSDRQKAIYTCASEPSFPSTILTTIRSLLEQKIVDTGQLRGERKTGTVHIAMVVGAPNVGKTTMINALRRYCKSSGILNVARVGKLEVGPYPGVTKHVTGIKVSENPTILLVDTPGIMLPKLTASTFAYRVELAGLVPEGRLPLQDLFAFTLYILAQKINKRQLKSVLAQALPDKAAAESSRNVRNNAAQLRNAYSSKRYAKCILQAINSIEEQLKDSSDVFMFPSEHVSSEHESGKSAPALGETQVQRRQHRTVHVTESRANSISLNEASRRRPKFAAEYLAMLGQDTQPEPPSLHPTVSTPSKTSDINNDHECYDHTGFTLHSVQEDTHPDTDTQDEVAWTTYRHDVWNVCAQEVLARILKGHRFSEEQAENKEHVTMTRIVKMVREGHMGRLLFEVPRH